jgi:hypothetical protein
VEQEQVVDLMQEDREVQGRQDTMLQKQVIHYHRMSAMY